MAQLKDTTINGDIDVTGGINLDGSINMASNNTSKIYGVGTDGAIREAFCPSDINDDVVIGYGGYADGVGATAIYGNEVSFVAADGSTITSNMPFRNHFYMCYRGGSLSAKNLTASYAPVGCNTMLVDTSVNLFDSGTVTVNGVSYSGIKCNKSGMILAWGYAYCTGLTDGDVIACCLYKNDTQYYGERVGSTKKTISTFAPLRPFSVTAGDVILLGVANLTAARGACEASSSTLLGAMYIK